MAQRPGRSRRGRARRVGPADRLGTCCSARARAADGQHRGVRGRACRAARPPKGRAVSARAAKDIAALQAALAAEQAASYGYGIIGSHLAGSRFAAAAADCVAHERARDSLTVMLTARGAQPRPAAAAYQLPAPVRTQAAALSLAVMLERQVSAPDLGLGAGPDAPLRAFPPPKIWGPPLRAARRGGQAANLPPLPAP